MKKLNARQEAFVHYMMTTGDPREAYRRAGYKPENADGGAYRVLHHPNVQKELGKRQERRNKTLALEEDYELRRAIEVLDMCMDGYGKPVTDEEGRFVMKFDSSGANSALLTICRLRGKFRDKPVIEPDFSDRAGQLNELLLKFERNKTE